MRLPFDFGNSDLNENARVKFIYTSPELHQNIEISIDGKDTSVETLVETFERFLGALGVCIPRNVALGFIDLTDEDDEDGEDGDKEISFELNQDDEEDTEEEDK